jgi:hypothetical protein
MKALSITLMLLFSTLLATAQNKGKIELPVPVKDSTICYEGILNANPELNAEQLFKNVKHWASTKLIAPPIVTPILYEDSTAGIISARVIPRKINLSPSVYTNYFITQGIIYIQIKQGRIKYTITDFIYSHTEETSSYKYVSEGNNKKLYESITTDKGLRSTRNEFHFYMTELDKQIQDYLLSLTVFINKPVIDEF